MCSLQALCFYVSTFSLNPVVVYLASSVFRSLCLALGLGEGHFVYFSILKTTVEISAARKVVLSMKTFKESVLFCVGHSVEFLVATWNYHWAFNWLPWVCCR